MEKVHLPILHAIIVIKNLQLLRASECCGNSIYIDLLVKMILEVKSTSLSKGNIWMARIELGGTVDTDAWVSHDILHHPLLLVISYFAI